MNILYIASIFPTPREGENLYTDLANELIENKNRVTVIVSEEKRKIDDTQISRERNYNVIRVRTGNLYEIGSIQKAISFITLQSKMKKAIDKYLSNEKFDMIIFMSPPVTMYSVVKYAMKKYNCFSYLMQKDIFPQNAVDLKIMTKQNPAYWYFRHKEKELYKISTVIGCMSKKNKEYLLKHNKYLNSDKLQIFPNTTKLSREEQVENINQVKKKYNIPDNKVIITYGGNFGKPQGIDFLMEVLDIYKDNKNVEFVLVGKGTEKEKLSKFIDENKIENVKLIKFLNSEEFSKILKFSDIGLVFLDYRFTIPNIPSKTLTYFKNKVPVMAATDINTDFKQMIEESNAGLWSESNDVYKFKKKLDFLIANQNVRKEMGENGRRYLEKNLTTEVSVKILEEAFKNYKGDGGNV